MSYAICRVQKIGGSKDIAGIQLHNRRQREHSNSNPDIDRERSRTNYTLKDTYMSYNKAVDERIAEGYSGKKGIRKDAVRMCEVLFTSDNDFFSGMSSDRQREYFNDCYRFACDRYGEKNIIAATVHLDEDTPHLHIDFVPLTKDGRLSAKEVLGGKQDLQKLQDDFYSFISRKWRGLERGKRSDLNNPNDKAARHLTVQELKKKTAAEIAKLSKKKQELEEDILSKEELTKIDVSPRVIGGGFKGLTPEQARKLKATAEQVDRYRDDNDRKLTEIIELKKKIKTVEDQRDCFEKQLKAERNPLSEKNQAKLKEKTDLINQNSVLKRAVGIPEKTQYADVIAELQKKGMIRSGRVNKIT